jgi:lipocalin
LRGWLPDGINADGTISVKNSQIQFGKHSSVRGTARPDGAPGKFVVEFTFGAKGNYWIVALGPETSEGKYAYSIVTDDKSSTLFVLARSVEAYESTYKTEIDTKLLELGFTGFFSRPIPTRQAGCTYSSSQ